MNVLPAMYPAVIATLLENCVLRNEEADCLAWPECEHCELVMQGYIKLPKVWDGNYDTDEQADWYQLCALLMKHIRGTCDGRVCLFCSIEKIPL